MHLRGKDFLYEAIYPDGKTETLLSVPRYDFDWQSVYRLAKPLPMPKGTQHPLRRPLRQLGEEPEQPRSDAATVCWGDQTWEEMMIGWVDFAYDRKEK